MGRSVGDGDGIAAEIPMRPNFLRHGSPPVPASRSAGLSALPVGLCRNKSGFAMRATPHKTPRQVAYGAGAAGNCLKITAALFDPGELSSSGSGLYRGSCSDAKPLRPLSRMRHPAAAAISDLFDIMQVRFDDRAHVGRMPVRLLGIFMPGKRQMPELSRFPGFCPKRQRRLEHPALSGNIPHLSHRSSVRVLDGGGAGDAHRPVKIMGGCQHQRRETPVLQKPDGQSHGLATERSGRSQQDGIHVVAGHDVDHGGNGAVDKIAVFPFSST